MLLLAPHESVSISELQAKSYAFWNILIHGPSAMVLRHSWGMYGHCHVLKHLSG